MTRIQVRRGTAAQWTAANPVLAAGEQGFETDTGKLKIGNGTTAWASLPYVTDTLSAYLPEFDMLHAALTDGSRSVAVQVIGDSTGNDATEWPYLLAETLATRYPAWTVKHRLWADASQNFGAATVLQTGAAGARYLDCSTGTHTRRMPAVSSPYISGVLDVRVKVTMDDWTPTSTCTVVAKNGPTDGNRSWYATLHSGGYLQLVVAPLGTAASTVTKSAAAFNPAWASGATKWLRWVYVPDNGAGGYNVEFYYSDDGITWTQLGAPVTTATPTVLFNNSAIGYEIGGQGGTISNTGMKVHEVEIRDGRDGPSVVPALPDLWPPYNSTAARVVGAPVLTVVNASQPGANMAYWTNGRLALATPDLGQVVTFVSDSHNEGLDFGPNFLAAFDTWRLAIEAATPGAPTVILTQNPETDGATWYREHAKRRLALVGYARQKTLGLVDTYQAFIDAGWPGSLMADAVHPNAAGSVVWRDAVLAAMALSPG